jgi:hypothetical protein
VAAHLKDFAKQTAIGSYDKGLPMDTFDMTVSLLAAPLLAGGLYLWSKRLSLPIRFISFDELTAVTDVARWANQQIPTGDPHKATILYIFNTLWPANMPYGIRLSKEEMAVLAPYVDRFIAGEAPPWNMPAEYFDWRPDALKAFRQRLKAEGSWPDTPADHNLTVPDKMRS